MAQTVLIVPGIHNSGPDHWQTLWENAHPSYRRVQMGDWDAPECAAWVAALDRAVADAPAPVLIVAHSLGCLAVVHWAQRAPAGRVHGALLVAVPDPHGAQFPATAAGFAPLPLQPLPFRAIVVASTDDPYASIAHARNCAAHWGSRLVEIGAAGHINGDSRLGAWDAGLGLLDSLR